jgi:hypothetical protein
MGNTGVQASKASPSQYNNMTLLPEDHTGSMLPAT